jgi:hypothetical protein
MIQGSQLCTGYYIKPKQHDIGRTIAARIREDEQNTLRDSLLKEED